MSPLSDVVTVTFIINEFGEGQAAGIRLAFSRREAKGQKGWDFDSWGQAEFTFDQPGIEAAPFTCSVGK